MSIYYLDDRILRCLVNKANDIKNYTRLSSSLDSQDIEECDRLDSKYSFSTKGSFLVDFQLASPSLLLFEEKDDIVELVFQVKIGGLYTALSRTASSYHEVVNQEVNRDTKIALKFKAKLKYRLIKSFSTEDLIFISQKSLEDLQEEGSHKFNLLALVCRLFFKI